MVVVGGRHGHRVKTGHGVQHLAVVGEETRPLELVENRLAVFRLAPKQRAGLAGIDDIAQRHDFGARRRRRNDVGLAFAVDADAPDLDPVVRAPGGRREQVETERRDGRGSQ